VAGDELLAQYGEEPLDPALELCLARGEVVVLGSDRVTFELTGERCFDIDAAEAEAFLEEQAELASAAIGAPIAEPAIPSSRRNAQRNSDVSAGRYGNVTRRVQSRRSGQSLPPPPPPPPPPQAAARPIIFRVANASPAVLDRYPRGSVVQRSSRLCLDTGEQITILGTNGQRVTYRGPGCLQRQTRPTRENLGGFIFG
jgi:hypothetical protein